MKTKIIKIDTPAVLTNSKGINKKYQSGEIDEFNQSEIDKLPNLQVNFTELTDAEIKAWKDDQAKLEKAKADKEKLEREQKEKTTPADDKAKV